MQFSHIVLCSCLVSFPYYTYCANMLYASEHVSLDMHRQALCHWNSYPCNAIVLNHSVCRAERFITGSSCSREKSRCVNDLKLFYANAIIYMSALRRKLTSRVNQSSVSLLHDCCSVNQKCVYCHKHSSMCTFMRHCAGLFVV